MRLTTATPTAPTVERIEAELRNLGRSEEVIDKLIAQFRQVGELAWAEQDGAGHCYICVDMITHYALDAIMPDLAFPLPGSLHERINTTFLPVGWTFWHDEHQFCSLEAVAWS